MFKLNELSNKKIILLIFTVALIIRLSIALFGYQNNIMEKFQDDNNYRIYAERIIEEGPFLLDNELLIVKHVGPVLPIIMAIMILLFGNGWLPIFILNSIIGSITCVIIYLIGKEIFDKKIGFIAAIWSVFYILFLKYIPTAGKETWTVFLFILLFYQIVTLKEKTKTILPAVLSGLIFTLLIHLDERYIVYLPVLIVYLIIADTKCWKWGFIKSSIFLISTLLFMTPWLVRNYMVYERPVILTIRTTVITDKIFGFEPLLEIQNSSLNAESFNRWHINQAQIDSVITYGTKVTMRNGHQIKEEQVKAMQKGILPKPMTKLETYISSFINLWEPIDVKNSFYHTGYRFDGKRSLRNNLSVGISYGIFLPFMIYGLILLVRKKKILALFILSIFITHSLVHTFFIPFSKQRYRIPIDFLIILIALYGITNIYNKLKIRKKLIKKSLLFYYINILFLHYKYATGKTKKYVKGKEKNLYHKWKDLFQFYLTEGEFFKLYYAAGYNLVNTKSNEFIGKKNIFKMKNKVDKAIKKYYGLEFDFDIITKDKFYTNSILLANGMPCIENIAFLNNGEILTNTGKLIRFDEIHKLGSDLVLKNTVLEASEGVMFLKVEKNEFILNRNIVTLDDLKKRLNKSIWVIQKRINSHNKIKMMNSSALNVLRIVTILDGFKPKLLGGFQAIATGTAETDSWTEGSLYIGVDFENGCLQKYGYRSPWHDNDGLVVKHPDSGITIEKYSIPFIKEAVDICLIAHRIFYTNFLLGWDIAITDEGPKIVEINEKPGMNVLQCTSIGLKSKLRKYAQKCINVYSE